MQQAAMNEWTAQHRITIVAGHYGSGKTEFAVNLAQAMAQQYGQVALADLDIVNPYFCARERAAMLSACGVRFIASSPACAGADVPAMPTELNALLHGARMRGVIDIGGNGTGARVLARYKGQLAAQGAQMLMVLNANRPQTQTLHQVAACLRSIEENAGLRVSGLVNNTHLCGDTQPGDVLRGAALAQEVSAALGLPVLCHVVPKRLVQACAGLLPAPVFPVQICMQPPWHRAPNGPERSGFDDCRINH